MEKKMTRKSAGETSRSLLRLVEERALSKKALEDEKKKEQHNVELVPYIPTGCLSNVLLRLPIQSLQRSSCVCKPWCKMIYGPYFIDAHLRRSETVLIFLTSGLEDMSSRFFSMKSIPPEKRNPFSVEADLCHSQLGDTFRLSMFDMRPKFHIRFMEIKDGNSNMGEFNATCLGDIRATCNGLILLDNRMKKGGLIVMNPVTRKLIALPLGTLHPPHRESYGLAFCRSTNNYKLVHLFEDELRYVGCEILIVGTRSWKEVDGPSFGLFRWLGFNPVSAIGALHWIPHIDHSDYIMSMILEDEKFHKLLLPRSCRTNDRIVEMSGVLSLVVYEEPNQIDIWILRSLNEDWTKQHSITLNCIRDMFPLYCTRLMGEMIFQDIDGSLYSYDFESELMKRIEMEDGVFDDRCCLPHVNSLVSWTS